MTKKEEQLLLKDLSARLPYGVKVKYYSMEYPYGSKPVILTSYLLWDRWENINEMRPYLRPMSNMTEEEKEELQSLCDGIEIDDDGNHFHYTTIYSDVESFRDVDFDAIDWLNAHHFDHRGLIEKGLALEAPEGMYKTE